MLCLLGIDRSKKKIIKPSKTDHLFYVHISSSSHIVSDGEIEASGKVKGADFATATLSFLGHTHVTAGTGAPTPPSVYTPPTN